jgi:thiamine biosynthesis lipoprotein
MGTTISLTLWEPDHLLAGELARNFFGCIRRLEHLLSRFLATSQLSRFAAGELALDDADPALREVLTRCDALRILTDGCFEHEPRRRSGNRKDPVLDPNAFAKGWIVEEAASQLCVDGAEDFLVNAGGDVVVKRRDGSPWRIGIQHPTETHAALGTIELGSGSVATSGTYERGHHIRPHRDAAEPSPRNGEAFTTVSVVGPDLAVADALATALWSAGVWLPRWWANVDTRYGVLAATEAGQILWSPPADPGTTRPGAAARFTRTAKPRGARAAVSPDQLGLAEVNP